MANPILAAGESLLKLAVLARELDKHPSSLSRWVATGVQTRHGRVKLEAVRVGRELRTSREALMRFLDAISGQPDERIVPPPSPHERRRAVDAAEAALVAAGA